MIKNKGMFYTGLAIIILEIIVGFANLFYVTVGNVEIADSTANIIIGGAFFGLLTITSLILMYIATKDG